MVAARIIVTAANSRYFGSLVTLLGSAVLNCRNIDRILIYDLGLSSLERLILADVRKVEIRRVPPFCPHYLDVAGFAWKTAAICDALQQGTAVLWLDAGIEIQGSLDDLFQTIEKEGCLFTVTPLDHPNCRIGYLSRQRSLELLGADTEFFRNSLMVNAGVMGYLRGHPASEIAFEAMQYAANPEIILGPRYSHRHDQTIYSVLRVRRNLPARYNIFHLENVDPDFPFLIQAEGQELVPPAVATRWKRDELYVYLLITRDRKPYRRLGSIEFDQHSFIARFLLRTLGVARYASSVARIRPKSLKSRSGNLAPAATSGGRNSNRAESGVSDED